MKPSGVVTLITDFGLEDPYVGMMKGVLLSVNPGVSIVDISHQVRPGDMELAAHIVAETYPFFPDGTVHVTVVDPGVGTQRRPITLITPSHLFVAPDNGILGPVMEAIPESQTVHLKKSRYFRSNISHTFHGRDVFAPVAGHLSRGADPFDMGPIIHDPVRLKHTGPHRSGGCLYGRVRRVDHFGNLITNISQTEMERFLDGDRPVVRIGDLTIQGLQETYGEAARGEAMALLDSSGYLEIAVNLGRAVDRLGRDPKKVVGTEVCVERDGWVRVYS